MELKGRTFKSVDIMERFLNIIMKERTTEGFRLRGDDYEYITEHYNLLLDELDNGDIIIIDVE